MTANDYESVKQQLAAVNSHSYGHWWLSQASRRITPWRLWNCMHKRLQSEFVSCFMVKAEHVDAYLYSMSERPRQRRLQQLPDQMKALPIACAKQGLSHYD